MWIVILNKGKGCQTHKNLDIYTIYVYMSLAVVWHGYWIST